MNELRYHGESAPDMGESNEDEAFREAAEARADANRALYPRSLLVACCGLWMEVEGICDDEGDAALEILKQELAADAIASETYREFVAGLDTPQTEAVDRSIELSGRTRVVIARHAHHNPYADRIAVLCGLADETEQIREVLAA